MIVFPLDSAKNITIRHRKQIVCGLGLTLLESSLKAKKIQLRMGRLLKIFGGRGVP